MRQLDLLRTWGGRRAGAGRKPSTGRRSVMHRSRPRHERRCPVHVTFRANVGLLRTAPVFPAVREAIAAASDDEFRVVQFSVQSDHVHLLVEAEGTSELRGGIQGLAIRIARAANRAMGRSGRFWADRYHARILRTPREVRHALVYVLANWRKHVPDARGIDPCSSARWFTGWKHGTSTAEGFPVSSARTWLAKVGWRRHGLIDADESPRPYRRAGRARARVLPSGGVP
jgi:REP element-mobilizing transposase RayT